MYHKLLTNPEITNEFLEEAFLSSNPEERLEKACLDSNLLKAVNLLKNGSTDTKQIENLITAI